MAASAGVTLDGRIRVQATLDALLRRGEDLSDLMAAIGAYGEESTVDRFEREEGPDGRAWTPSRRARVQGGQTLTDSGRLKGSIGWRADATSAEWGTNVIYAGVHQFGGTIRAKAGGRLRFNIPGLGFRSPQEVVMPERPFLGVNEADETEIEALIQDVFGEVLP